jgi:hypothetical protein
MTRGEKESLERSRWSDFDSLINPNHQLIEKMVRVLLPLAVLMVFIAAAMIIVGKASLLSLLTIIFVVAFLAGGASGSSEPLSRR